MFTKSLFKGSLLDRAVVLSIIAMLGFNIVVLTTQLHPAPQVALTQGNAAQQA